MTWRTLHTHTAETDTPVLAPWWAEDPDENPTDDEEPPPSQG